jgi:hypothetical protein
MLFNNFAQTGNHQSGRYMEMIATLFTGPTVLCADVFAVWSLTANLDLTSSFPWRAGALSNWMVWLIIALLLHLIAWGFRSGQEHG